MDIKFEKLPKTIPDRILVVRDKPVLKSESGILLVTETIPTTGTVISVGEDNKNYDPMELLQPGVKVMFGDWAGVEFEHENTKILSMRIIDIFLIFT